MKIVLLLGFFVLSAHATYVKFQNRCLYPVEVFTVDEEGVTQLQEYLNPGFNDYEEYTKGSWIFKNGRRGLTQAEITFNERGMDWFDINLVDGFDISMALTSPDGLKIACFDENCNGAVLAEQESYKEHSVRTGGKFILTFCP